MKLSTLNTFVLKVLNTPTILHISVCLWEEHFLVFQEEE